MTLSISYAKTLVKEIEQVSPTLFKIYDNTIKIQTKKGRCFLTCSCQNHSLFPNESFCVHKLAIVIYLSNGNFNKKIDKIISDYEKYKDCKLKPSVNCFLNDLRNLKRAK